MTTEEIMEYEYELIDICIDNGYEQGDEDNGWSACEETSTDNPAAEIEYDADGIPMGNSKVEYEIRQKKIVDFLRKWGEINSDRKVLNEALGDYIFIKGISVIEAKEHSAKRYRSTCAVMIIDEILANAKPVGRVPVKKGNRNQEPFAYMLIMVYRHSEIGTIKLTVGVKSTSQRIQYGLTALDSGQPVIEQSSDKQTKKKKRSPHK